MRKMLLAMLAVAAGTHGLAAPAAAVPARPMAAEASRFAATPVTGRIPYGYGYRYTSPYYSYGYPRLYYYPWGLPPRSVLRHRRTWYR